MKEDDVSEIIKKENNIFESKKMKDSKRNKPIGLPIAYILIILVIGVMAFNQFQIWRISSSSVTGFTTASHTSQVLSSGNGDLSGVDVSTIKSTAQGVAALFPVDTIKTADDAIAVMIPTGTPEYGEGMGVSFDKPVESMELMARSYSALKKQIQENEPEVWQRYLNLAAAPRGISCEFCCGVGAQGVDSNGNLRCGCKHNPATQTLTLWLLQNTDYSDAEVLREVYRWKSIFFPRNMVSLATKIAGGDTEVLKDLPGMVGGC